MDTAKIKDLGLTTRDFDLIGKGLDSIKVAESTGEMTAGLIDIMMSRGNPGMAAEMKRKMALMNAKKKRELDILLEDVYLLRGKIIQLKRLMIENDLMEQIPPPPR